MTRAYKRKKTKAIETKEKETPAGEPEVKQEPKDREYTPAINTAVRVDRKTPYEVIKKGDSNIVKPLKHPKYKMVLVREVPKVYRRVEIV